MRTICVVSGTRAEFGLLRALLERLNDHPAIRLQLVLTGTHLTSEFGDSLREVEESGFEIAARVPALVSGDTPTCAAKSVGLGVIGFADAFASLEPDLAVVLGDRTEIFAAAQAAWIATIPLAHIHGGEVTVGAIDDGIRHAITKLSALHFVATARAALRVVQLGEDPERVFHVGSLGVEAAHELELYSRAEVETRLGAPLRDPLLLVTFHPETQREPRPEAPPEARSEARRGTCSRASSQTRRETSRETPGAADPLEDLEQLFEALSCFRSGTILWTASNCDAGGAAINHRIEAAVREHAPHWLLRHSLGQRLYLSCLRLAAAVVGNSSSGIIEAPAFGTPSINIGGRQEGRERARSVVDVGPKASEIQSALERVLDEPGSALARSPEAARETPAPGDHPYEAAGGSARIAQVLAATPLDDLRRKRFHDLAVPDPHA